MAATGKPPGRPEKMLQCSERWEMPFNINKCHFLHMGTRSKKNDCQENGVRIKSVHCVEDVGVTTSSSLKFSHQCKDATSTANRRLGFINRSFKSKNMILPLYISLIRPYMGYTVQYWSPLCTKAIYMYSKIRNCSARDYTEIIQSYERRLASLNLFLVSRTAGSQINLLSVLKYLKPSPMLTQISCSQLIINQELGVTRQTKMRTGTSRQH